MMLGRLECPLTLPGRQPGGAGLRISWSMVLGVFGFGASLACGGNLERDPNGPTQSGGSLTADVDLQLGGAPTAGAAWGGARGIEQAGATAGGRAAAGGVSAPAGTGGSSGGPSDRGGTAGAGRGGSAGAGRSAIAGWGGTSGGTAGTGANAGTGGVVSACSAFLSSTPTASYQRTGADQGCLVDAYPLLPQRAVVEFLVDNSASLADDASPTNPGNDDPEWTLLEKGLIASFCNLPPSWAVGTIYYGLAPNPDNPAACYQGQFATKIAPISPAQIQSLVDSIPSTCQGGAPTMAAWQVCLDQRKAWPTPAEYATSPRHVVLIAAGPPTIRNDGCYGSSVQDGGEPIPSDGLHAITEAEYDRFIAAVKSRGEGLGYKTYVIGVAGSEDPRGATYDPLYKLSQLAEAGGTVEPGCIAKPGTVAPTGDTGTTVLAERGSYCHLDRTQAVSLGRDLAVAVQSLVAAVTDCTYLMASLPADRPVDFEFGTLLDYYPGGSDWTDYRGGVRLEQNAAGETDPTCATADPATSGSGWYYSKRDEFSIPTELKLCPNTCAEVGSDVGALLVAAYPCLDMP